MAKLTFAFRRAVALGAAAILAVPAAAVAAGTLRTYDIVAPAVVFAPQRGEWAGGYGSILGSNPIYWSGQKMQRTEDIAGGMEMIKLHEAQAEAQAYQGMLDGTYAPLVRFTEGSTDIASRLAKAFARAGLRGMSEHDAASFLSERQADYAEAVTAQHLPVNSLTSACGYWVETLYRVGAGVAASDSDLERIRATCALTIGKSEKLGSLTTNEQRFSVGRTLAMLGGTFRTLASRPAQHDDAVAGARAVFKSTFGYALDAVPVSRFACVLSDNNMADCDLIMSRYAARLPEIARRNT